MEENGDKQSSPPEKAKLTEKDITGLKYFDQIAPLLQRLHDACDRNSFKKAKSQAHAMCRSLQEAKLFERWRTAHEVCLLRFLNGVAGLPERHG